MKKIDIPSHLLVQAKEAIDKYNRDYGNEIIFLNISGAHLFGTATPSSDIDLRGCYIVTTDSLLKFNKPRDTIETSKGDVEIQIHEAEKFLSLMVNGNMNFIEEVLSPLRVVDTPLAEEFRKFAQLSLSKDTYSHVKGMTIHMKKHAQQENFVSPKRNLYLLRELLRGIVLFRDGLFESNVTSLAELYGNENIKSMVTELITLKVLGQDYDSINEFRELISFLEGEMLKAKEFGTLRLRPVDNLRSDVEKMLLKLRLSRIGMPKS